MVFELLFDVVNLAKDLGPLQQLAGRVRRDIALVLAHGFTSGKHSLDNLAGYLAARGYEALTFDFVGHKLGCSGGAMQTITQAPGNVADALAWLRRNSEADRIVLVGHSMGAAAAIAAAAWEIAERSTPALIGKIGSKDVYGAPLAGVVSLCMGTEPSAGFDSAIGAAMLQQRCDYVTGAPAGDLVREIDSLVLSAANLGSLPALFIAAKQDVLVAVDRVIRLAQLVHNSAVQVIDSSHMEAPDKARPAIYAWLSQL